MTTTTNDVDEDDIEIGDSGRDGDGTTGLADDNDETNNRPGDQRNTNEDKDGDGKDDDNDGKDGDDDDDDDDDDYVTYIRPKRIQVLPPAKYKLFLVTFVGVWFAEWVASLTGIYSSIQKTTNLSHNGTVFLIFGTIVAVLVFGTVELMIKYINVTLCEGKVVVGIGPWFKQPRIVFFKRYTNVFSQTCDRIIHIVENGFDLFSAAPPSPPSSPPQAGGGPSSTSTSTLTSTSVSSSPSSSTGQSRKNQFVCAKPEDVHNDVVLRIVSRVQPTKIDQYKKWVRDFQSLGCLSRPGMKHVYTNLVDDGGEGDDKATNGSSNADEDGVVYVWYITFANIDYLNDFMTSPVRDRMVRNLQPLLVTRTLYQLTQERALPDTFTDIVTPQSGCVPTQLPSKWKVWTVTTLSLWFTNMIGDATLRDHYYTEWGVDDSTHPRARATLSVLFNVFFNVYIMAPFITMLFGHWLERKADEHTTLEPWRTFNDGFKTDWAKLLVTIAYYGGCIIGYIVKSS